MIWRRFLWAIPLLVIVSMGVFSLELLLPGDAAVALAGQDTTPQRTAEIRHSLNLDQPVWVRYGDWAVKALHGDFGKSLYTSRGVASEIAARWAVTGSLVAGAVIVALLLSVPLALIAGRNEGGWADRLITVGASLGVAVPSFVLGMIGVILFAVALRWLPIAGYTYPSKSIGDWLKHLILPVLALSAPMVAVLARQLRSALADVLKEDYMRTAYAKGLREHVVLMKHALRAAAPPAVSILGVEVARLLGGAVVVESVFALPGLGLLTITAILNRDLPMIQGVVPLMVLVAIVCNLAADTLNLLLNPRIRSAVLEG